MAIDYLQCICGHRKFRHYRSTGRCDDCTCLEFGTDMAESLKGEMCVTPGPPTPYHNGGVIKQSSNGSVAKERGVTESGLKDSGERLQFDSGMVRDISTDKPRFDLVIPVGIPFDEQMLTRWAELLRKGAIKYSERNWEQADSNEELNRAKESAFRHFMQWFTGETDEDHAAAVFFNITEVETIKYKQANQKKEV